MMLLVRPAFRNLGHGVAAGRKVVPRALAVRVKREVVEERD